MMQNQKQRSIGNKNQETTPSPAPAASRAIRSAADEQETVPSDLFMQEDEMTSWLYNPADDNSLETYLYSNNLLYPTPSFSAPVAVAPTYVTPPPPPSIILPSRSSNLAPELQSSAIVASNATPSPAAGTHESRASRVSDKLAAISVGNDGVISGIGAAGTLPVGREIETCEMSVSMTSSPGSSGSGASDSMEPSSQKLPSLTDDRKRKPGGDTDDTKIHNELDHDGHLNVEFAYPDLKKQSHGGSTSIKRSRSTEVHNLSERRRRDRINEKMKALQELIPRCNKSDKASLLDEAIEYLKALQMQVQMMSAQYTMVPMMFPGAQHYMPPMAMGMGMNQAMFPYPPVVPGSSLPNPAVAVPTSAAHLQQCYPVPGFNMTPGTVGGPTANLSAPMMSPLTLDVQNQPRALNFTDPFQRYHGLHQTRLPFPQNQGAAPPISTKPSSSKDATNTGCHHQTSKPRSMGFHVD